MAETKRQNAELVQGITQPLSGTTLPIDFQRNGVIKGLNESIKVKRPNQYLKKRGY